MSSVPPPIVIDRHELACLGMALDESWIQLLDGNVGLLHIGADIDGARHRLAGQRVLLDADPTNSAVNESHPWVRALRVLSTAPVRANLALSSSDTVRQCYFFGDSHEVAWVIGPSVRGSFEEFTISPFKPRTIQTELFALCSLDLTAASTSVLPEESWYPIPWSQLRALKGCLTNRDRDAAVSILLECGLDRATARKFANGLFAGATSCELNVMIAGTSGAKVEALAWNVTESGEWWLFDRDPGHRTTRFTVTESVRVAARLRRATEMIS